MQRWHLTAGLASLAGLAVFLAPSSQARTQTAPITPLTVDPIVATPVAVPIDIQHSSGGALHLSAGLDHPAVLRGATDERFLVITVGADEVEGDPRPINVAVVIDRSGSMNEQGKMEYARDAAKEIVNSLDEGDRFSLVTFSDRSTVVVPSTPADDPSRLYRAIDSVYEGGGTNLYAGLVDGQAQVSDVRSDRSVNRVIVLSDGKANVGITRPSALASQAGLHVPSGVSVSTIGLGLDYNEDNLAAMADTGGGTYRFVDDPTALAQIFREELHQLDSVAAEGVDVNVSLPGVELIDVLGYDETVTSDGFSVRLGDIYGGQTRKIVAKVRITGAGDSVDVADVSLTRSDAGGDVSPVDVLATVTAVPQVVETTVHRELAILANEAEASELALAGTKAWSDGDTELSTQLLDSSALIAGQAGSRYGDAKLEEQAAELNNQNAIYQANKPTSNAGKRAAKGNKELYRDWSH
mgnify:CR=1 FL=1